VNAPMQTDMDLGELDMAAAVANAGESISDDKWPRTLAALVDVLIALYRSRGRAEDDAIAEARAVVLTLAQWQGGRPIYFPRGDRLLIALRNREIFHRHRGKNGEALAMEHGLTLRQIQVIVAEQYALQVRKRQGTLFQREEGEER